MATAMRQAIARHMTYSKQHIPHYYLTMRPDVSAAMQWRNEWNIGREKDDTISVNDLMVKATALALTKHPEFNGFYREDGFQPQPQINLGIAIALPDGLIAPALLDCGALSMAEIAQRSRDLVARARKGVLKADEYTAATFTITNLGMYHVESFTAIIVPPQVAILAVGSVEEAPAMRDGVLTAAHPVALTLSGDHRATDGAEGARFLGDIVEYLQHPAQLFG